MKNGISGLGSALLASLTALLAAPAGAANPLPRSLPEAQGVDSAGLRRFVAALEQRVDAVHSLMLVRHGRVVAEGYWAPYRPEDRHVMYSATKSFTSTAVGFASQEGLLSVDDTVLSHFPEHAPKQPDKNMQEMRLRDLLRMSTGHDTDPSDRVREAKDGAGVKAFLATRVSDKPGTHFLYNSGGTYMLAAVVQKVSGQTVQEYLTPRLFEPLGIDSPVWAMSEEGINKGAGGLFLHTEDLAKFGQFYLQKGVWEGKPLLNEPWITAATSRQTSTGGNPSSNWDHGYGYQFWMNKVEGFRADGAYGQFAMVLPKYDAVVAITSGTGDMGGVMETVWEALLPALRPEVLPANPKAHARLQAKLTKLELAPQAGQPTGPLAGQIEGRTYSLRKNELGLKTASFAFKEDRATLRLGTAEGPAELPCGLSTWIRGKTPLMPKISSVHTVAEQGVAASCAWSDPTTFVVKICFTETAYTVTQAFNFGDGARRLEIATEHNLRWGPTQRPRIRGRRLASRRASDKKETQGRPRPKRKAMLSPRRGSRLLPAEHKGTGGL